MTDGAWQERTGGDDMIVYAGWEANEWGWKREEIFTSLEKICWIDNQVESWCNKHTKPCNYKLTWDSEGTSLLRIAFTAIWIEG